MRPHRALFHLVLRHTVWKVLLLLLLLAAAQWSAFLCLSPDPASIGLPDGLLSFPVCNARAAWNGEKLALGIYDGETLATGLSLWIYDREGTILYQGDYATSLEQVYVWHTADADTLTTGSPVQVVERNDRALTLSWKS